MLDSDFQEAFTSVLDINSSEIYTEQASLPTSSLPYSGSSQNLQYITSGSSEIAQFWYRLEMSPSDTITSGKHLTWFTLSGSVEDVGYESASSAQVIQANQMVSFISNKYAQPSLAGNKTEDGTPGYNVTIRKGSDNTDGNSARVDDTAFVFDYKTGILQFIDSTAAPDAVAYSSIGSNRMWFSGYQYQGQTLDQFVASGSGGGSGAGFPFSGSALITGSLLVSGSTEFISNGDSGIDFKIGVPVTASSDITSSAGVDVLNITASGAIFTSASISHLKVDSIISGSTVIASGSNTFGDAMDDVQTLIGTTKMTGSANVTGSFEVSGSTLLSGSTDIAGILSITGITNVSQSISEAGGTAGIFTETGSFFATQNALQITGSTLQDSPLTATGQNITSSGDGTGGGAALYDVVTSHSMWNYNHNVGVPKSNAWKYNLNGSHFDNFDQNTDVSEILRFVAGLLSSSAPGAAPNTRTYGAISQFAEQNGTAGSKPAGIVPNDFNDPTITYLDSKGFVNIGDQLFYNISASLKSNIGRSRTFESDPAGSTIVSSSVTPGGDLFGLGLIGLEVSLSSSASFRFVDNMSDTNTFISASQGSISQTGTGGGTIKIGNLITANPAVIPNTFQDGLVEEAFSTPLNFINTIPLNESGSTGYYFTTQSIALKTGSSALTSFKENKEVVFLITGSLNGKLNTQTLLLGNQASSSISATSRSLSGAPYLRTANYINQTNIEGAFNPMYVAGTTTIGQFSLSSDSKITAGNPTANVRTGTINASDRVGTTNFIFSSTNEPRTIGVIPSLTDIIILSASYAFSAGTSGGSNIATNGQGLQTGNGNAQFQVTPIGKNRSGGNTSATYTQPYHEAGTLGQPTVSGSLAYFGFAQTSDGNASGSITAANVEVNEAFTSETYRASLTDVALSASYSTMGKIATGSFATYNLGAKDLQVKPGFLVYPGDATYGYWLEDPDDGETFKYYLRSYTKTFNGSAGSLKFRLRNTANSANASLNAWSNTSDDGIAALVLVQNRGLGGTSFIANPGSGTSEFNGKASWVDMSDANGAFTAKTNFTAGTLGTNPFGVDITVSGMGAQGSSVSSGLSTMVCLANQFTTIPNSDPGIMVLVRYKGTPIAPISRIGVELT